MADSFEFLPGSKAKRAKKRLVDTETSIEDLMTGLGNLMTQAVVSHVYPVTVVSLSGHQVLLSRGREALAAGQRWEATLVKEPGTRQSPYTASHPIGVIRVERVSDLTAIGTFEDGLPLLYSQHFPRGQIQLTRKAAAKKRTPSSLWFNDLAPRAKLDARPA